jgi:hypothetical protein
MAPGKGKRSYLSDPIGDQDNLQPLTL